MPAASSCARASLFARLAKESARPSLGSPFSDRLLAKRFLLDGYTTEVILPESYTLLCHSLPIVSETSNCASSNRSGIVRIPRWPRCIPS